MITLHLRMCKYCRRLKKQMLLLSEAARLDKFSTGDVDQSTVLSLEARERIKNKLAAALTDFTRG